MRPSLLSQRAAVGAAASDAATATRSRSREAAFLLALFLVVVVPTSILAAIGRFDGRAEVSTWLYRICVNVALNAPLAHTVTYEWNHHLGEIVNAVIGAGLRPTSLRELPYGYFPSLPSMSEDADGNTHLPSPLAGKLPLQFALKAIKG